MLNHLQKLKKDQKGFTIIEVMIVLAIAGLIILVVLLAVPALQRNGRNTAIKNDASSIAGGISESESNNDGTAPTNVAGTGTITITNASNTNAKVQGSTVVTFTASTGSAPANTGPATGTITVLAGHKCTFGGTYTPGTTGDAAGRSFAIYYTIENSGGIVQKCIES